MYKVSIVISFLFIYVSLNADFIDDYYHGKYNAKNRLYALSSIDTHEVRYKEKIRADLHSNIASQIYSRINTSSKLHSSDIDGVYKKSFIYNATLTTEDIPLYHISYIREKVRDDTYYALAVFDFEKSESTYVRRVNEFIIDINILYSASKKKIKLYQKEKLLKQAILSYKNLQKHQLVLSLFLDDKTILKPKVELSQIQSELILLHDSSAKNIEDLVKILAQRLSFSHINAALLVEPIMLRDGHMYSEFSYEFKDCFTNELKNYTHLSQNEDSKYKVNGFYHLDNDIVIVNIFILDNAKNIISSSSASMKITSDIKLLKKYKPLKDESDKSKILDEYLKSW